jgi:hypothetical protein
MGRLAFDGQMSRLETRIDGAPLNRLQQSPYFFSCFARPAS